jgi:hypothetical protein
VGITTSPLARFFRARAAGFGWHPRLRGDVVVLRRLGLSVRAGADLVAVDPAICCWSLGVDLSGVLEPLGADETSAAQDALVGL